MKIDEGVVYEIYNDHLGYPTFGVGHLITPKDPEYGKPLKTKVSEKRVREVFEKDLDISISECKILYPNFDDYPCEVQEILVNMMFNMGRPRLSKFKKMNAAIDRKDWKSAAAEMENSAWFKQVGNRALRLKKRMLEVKN